MALNIDTQDLVNYPGTVKRVTIDTDSIVPTGQEGDEKIVMTASTTAYSDNTARTAIQDLYITDFKAGWCKSSGFAGSGGKFSLDSDHYKLWVKIDNTVSGTWSGYYEIDLTYNEDSTPISGEAVAADMEEQIRAITLDTADTGYSLSYKNASVEYMNGKFYIVSGSVSSYYTGANRSSVKVRAASTKDCSVQLGFNMSMDSQRMAGITSKEVALSSDYTVADNTVSVNTGLGVSVGQAYLITDGYNTDYFTALTGSTESSIAVAVSGTNGFHAISNNYATASGTKVQKLVEQDTDAGPDFWYTDMDAIGRWAIKSLVNQIDYSS